ncbi:MAG: cytidylyltransferase domain-containing protein [Burkholderiales bacterium]
MTKIGALIPIRLPSSRLPGKALKSIVGRPTVHHLLDRCFASRYIEPAQVVVCTTTDPEDDPLVPVVESIGAQVFRGSRDDLIDRLYRAADYYGLEIILQVDGDDICTDTLYMDLCTEVLLNDEAVDVAYGEGLPLGLSTRVVRTRAFKKVFDCYKPGKNDTGFMYYLTRSGFFNVVTVKPRSPRYTHPTARLTLDYEEDLAFFTAIFERLYRPGKVFGVEEICDLLKREPDLLRINAGLDEKYWKRTRELVNEESLEIRTPDGVRRIEG